MKINKMEMQSMSNRSDLSERTNEKSFQVAENSYKSYKKNG